MQGCRKNRAPRMWSQKCTEFWHSVLNNLAPHLQGKWAEKIFSWKIHVPKMWYSKVQEFFKHFFLKTSGPVYVRKQIMETQIMGTHCNTLAHSHFISLYVHHVGIFDYRTWKGMVFSGTIFALNFCQHFFLFFIWGWGGGWRVRKMQNHHTLNQSCSICEQP